MAVCNLFNALECASGNFMLFSQYVEDITRNFSDGDNWKVVPSRFVALNIDYSKVNEEMVMPNGEDLNEGLPKYLQNCFENACAYGRNNYTTFARSIANPRTLKWNPEISRNLFWNFMFDGKLLNATKYGSTKKVDEVMYWGDINMHTYDEHNGMGYGEIYCYIPSDATKKNCQVVCITDSDPDGRQSDISNDNILLEGQTDKYVENYSKQYFYNRDFTMTFDDTEITTLLDGSDSKYDINTIVVLYDVMQKINDGWETVYSYIPMGMYITGRFDGTTLTNTIKKYVTSSYGVGTSYGLRICTRFSVSPNGTILKNSETTTDNADITTNCQIMAAMAENLSLMLEMSRNMNDTTQSYKNLLSTIKNNRTNVPYVKDVNGSDWWFVNGRPVVGIDDKHDSCCTEVSKEILDKRIENIKKTLMDDNKTNDYQDFTKIYDGTGCECEEQTIGTVVDHIQKCLDPTFEWTGTIDGCVHDFEFATDEDVFGILDSENPDHQFNSEYQMATDKEVEERLNQE
jgi:hypothetical protein